MATPGPSTLDQEGREPWTDAQARQTLKLRWIALVLAIVIIIFLLTVAGLHALSWPEGREYSCYEPLNCPESDGLAQVLLVVAPMAAATAITIFLLIGVFRGFRSKDMESPSLRTMLQEALNDAAQDQI